MGHIEPATVHIDSRQLIELGARGDFDLTKFREISFRHRRNTRATRDRACRFTYDLAHKLLQIFFEDTTLWASTIHSHQLNTKFSRQFSDCRTRIYFTRDLQ